jgi:tetratricopeptide (TPR) repeat protein
MGAFLGQIVRAGAVLLLTVALTACRAAHDSTSAAPPADAPTFSKDVAPILFERCAPCHHPGGSGPFSLTDYDSVRKRGHLIRTAVAKRFMPPWLPEPGELEFAGNRRLSDRQLQTIERWVDDGMPEGDARDLPRPPQFSNQWQLGDPDLVVRMPRPYVLASAGSDVWRNFVIPIPAAESRYVKTIELRPGSGRFVHHALMAIDETQSSRRRDAADPDVGFDGMDMGDAHMPDGSLLGWTPGMLPFPGIDDVRWRLDPGTDLVLQLHMVPSGKAEIIDPEIGFYFARGSGPGSPTYVLQLDADDQLDIPAGAADFTVADTIPLPVDAEALVVYPHAHYLGKRIEALATLSSGAQRPLLRIDRWDFKWQDVYRYEQPVALPKGTSLSMRWTFDNSEANPRQSNHPPQRVRAGNRSSEEMAHLQIQLRLRTAADRDVLKEAHLRHLVQKNPQNAKFLYGLGGVLKDQGHFSEAENYYRQALAVQPNYAAAHINLGAVLMARNNAREAIDHFRAAVAIDSDAAGAHYNLAFAYAATGRLDESIRSYAEALRCRPDFAEAHANLGQVLSARGRLDEAIAHLREAARLLPNSSEVHKNLGLALRTRGNEHEALRELQHGEQLEGGHTRP